MKQNITLPDNPIFNSVNGLRNRTFDANNIVSGRGATEDQLKPIADQVNEMQAFLDENGCQNAPDDLYRALSERLDDLETLQEQCCAGKVSQENLDGVIQGLSDRLDVMEAMIEDCCSKDCFGGGETTGAPGDNSITVTFEWNGDNPFSDGGKATATCSNGERSIVGYWFLVRDGNTGIYFRASSAYGGDFTWRIDQAGNVTSSSGGGQVPYAVAIVAVDDANNEGSVSVNLPIEINVVGG